MSVEAHIGDDARAKYLAARNREFDRVRFTGEAPNLPEFAAHVHTFTPRNAKFPTHGGALSDFAIFVGDDLDAVRAAAAVHPHTDITLFRQRDDLHPIAEA